MRGKLYSLLEGPANTTVQLTVHLGIQVLIVLNVAAVVLGTVEPMGSRYATQLEWFELVSVGIFSVEYVARLASCTVDRRYQGPLLGRLRFGGTPLAIVDLLAILPAYLPLLGIDLRAVRAVRLLRVFRILKLGRYSTAVQSLGRALADRRAELAIVSFALLIILILASSVLYYAENAAQPEGFSSIPAAAWWGVTTLTTVGYGDLAPVTPLGKLAASVVAVLEIDVDLVRITNGHLVMRSDDPAAGDVEIRGLEVELRNLQIDAAAPSPILGLSARGQLSASELTAGEMALQDASGAIAIANGELRLEGVDLVALNSHIHIEAMTADLGQDPYPYEPALDGDGR